MAADGVAGSRLQQSRPRCRRWPPDRDYDRSHLVDAFRDEQPPRGRVIRGPVSGRAATGARASGHERLRRVGRGSRPAGSKLGGSALGAVDGTDLRVYAPLEARVPRPLPRRAEIPTGEYDLARGPHGSREAVVGAIDSTRSSAAHGRRRMRLPCLHERPVALVRDERVKQRVAVARKRQLVLDEYSATSSPRPRPMAAAAARAALSGNVSALLPVNCSYSATQPFQRSNVERQSAA
jgi:hypothetical protein